MVINDKDNPIHSLNVKPDNQDIGNPTSDIVHCCSTDQTISDQVMTKWLLIRPIYDVFYQN